MGQIYSTNENDVLIENEHHNYDITEQKFNEMKEPQYDEIKTLEIRRISMVKMLSLYDKQLSDKKQKLKNLDDEILLRQDKIKTLDNELRRLKENYFRERESIDDYKYNKSKKKDSKNIRLLNNISLV
jgi:hypothetical protein